MQRFSFKLMHKFGVQNRVTDALSRIAKVLAMMSAKIMGFDCLKDLYEDDVDSGRSGGSVLLESYVVTIIYVRVI